MTVTVHESTTVVPGALAAAAIAADDLSVQLRQVTAAIPGPITRERVAGWMSIPLNQWRQYLGMGARDFSAFADWLDRNHVEPAVQHQEPP